jgi:hypothetical protein
MAALWGLMEIALVVLGRFVGVTTMFWWQGPIYRGVKSHFNAIQGVQLTLSLILEPSRGKR